MKFLEKKYKSKNVNFLGKIDHKDLPEIISNYDVNINCAKRGFYDKSVLETLSMGIINFYRNDDFNSLFLDDQKFYFENVSELTKKINSLEDLSHNDILKIFDEIEFKLQENSLRTLSKRLISYL